MLIDYVNYNDIAREGNTLQLVNSEWCEGPPTPGSKNVCLSEEEDVELKILEQTFIANITVNKLFRVDFHGTKQNCSEEKDVISVSYNITNSTSIVKEGNFTVEVGCWAEAGTGEWTPTVEGNYTLCGIITSTTSGNADSSNDFVCANITVIPNPLTIIEKPSSLRFGDFGFVIFKFELNEVRAEILEINKSSLRFLAYTPSGAGHYVIKDLNNEIIYSVKGCRSDLAIQINNVSVNNTFYVALPFFIGWRCDNEWAGSYTTKIRIFNLNLSDGKCPSSCTGNRCVDLAEFKVHIDGYNELFCKACSGDGERSKTKNLTDLATEEKIKVEILSAPSEALAGSEIEIKAKITNSMTARTELEVYSYIYKGRELASEGGWAPNKQAVTLEAGQSKIFSLKNKIKDSAKGNYTLKVRAKEQGKNYDATQPLLILSVNASTSNALPRIKSFYSLAREFEPKKEINLWARIENPTQKEIEAELILIDEKQLLNQTIIKLQPRSSIKLKFEVLPEQKQVKYILILKSRETFVDSASLELNLSNFEKAGEEKGSLTEKVITGKAMTDSSRKVLEYAPWVIAGIAIFFLIWKRKL